MAVVVALAVGVAAAATGGVVLLGGHHRAPAQAASSTKHTAGHTGHQSSPGPSGRSQPATTSGAPAPAGGGQGSSAPAQSTPGNGDVALVAIATGASQVTVDNGQLNTEYQLCAGFQAVSPSGQDIGVDGLAVGDYARPTLKGSCMATLSLVAPPASAACQSAGSIGDVIVTWEGANAAAHAVLYQGAAFGSPIQVVRWCTAPTVENSQNAAVSLAQIPKGSMVTLAMGYGQWVTGITVQ